MQSSPLGLLAGLALELALGVFVQRETVTPRAAREGFGCSFRVLGLRSRHSRHNPRIYWRLFTFSSRHKVFVFGCGKALFTRINRGL
jgi:hypothetical protein